MNVKERMMTINLMNKAKKNEAFAKDIGLSVEMKKREKSEKVQRK